MVHWKTLPKKYQDQVEDYKSTGVNTKLVIPGELPTMNEIINQSKTHWTKYRKLKEKIDEKIAWYATKQKIKFFKSVKLKITYYRKNRRYDPDNILSSKKFILDGLVQAGVLEEDGWKQIKGFNESWKVDKKNPRTEINFEEVK